MPSRRPAARGDAGGVPERPPARPGGAHGHPREDAELRVPARLIPRGERRVIGALYGSSRPERDFPLILDAYRRGRLPLDRLISTGCRSTGSRTRSRSCAAARPAGRCSSSPRRAHEDRRDRDAQLPLCARPAAARRLGSGAAHAPGRDARARHRRRRHRAAARAATRCRTRPCSSGCCVGVDPFRTRGRARGVRDRRLPRRPPVDARGGRVGSRRPGARRAAVAAARRPQRVARRLRVERRAGRGGRAGAARCVALRDAGVRARQAALRRRGLAPRRGGGRGGARRGRRAEMRIMVDANQGWRMPGDRCAALGRRDRDRVRPRARAARASSGWRSRCATDDVDGYAALRRRHVAAAGRRRDGARGGRGARPGRARRRRRDPARRRPRGRDRRVPPDRRARRPARPDVVAAHLVERLRAGGEPACRARVLDLPVHRGAVRPARVVGRAPRLAAAGAGRDRGGRHDPPAGRARASASSPTSTRSSATGWHERRTLEIRAAVLERHGRPVRVEQLLLHPPQPRRGARARRRGRGVPLRPAPRPGPSRRRPLADRARARGRRGGRGRRRERHPRAPGRRGRRSASCRRAGRAGCACAGARTCARPRPSTRWPGC